MENLKKSFKILQENYREYAALNSSLIKQLLTEEYTLEPKDIKGEAITIGNIIDRALTNNEELEDIIIILPDFIHLDPNKPRPQYETFLNEYANILAKEDVIDVNVFANLFFNRPSDKNNADKIIELNAQRLDILAQACSTQKYIISDKDVPNLIEMIRVGKEAIKNLIGKHSYYTQIGYITGLQIKDGNYEAKCLIDLLVVDEENKIIYPYDLKTSLTFNDFKASAKKFMYDIQKVWYEKILRDIYEPSGYTVEDLKFLVITRNVVRSRLYMLHHNEKTLSNIEKACLRYHQLKKGITPSVYELHI